MLVVLADFQLQKHCLEAHRLVMVEVIPIGEDGLQKNGGSRTGW